MKSKEIIYWIEKQFASTNMIHAGFPHGIAGLSVFYFLMFTLTNERKHVTKCKSLFRAAIETIRSNDDNSILNEYCGITWTHSLLQKNKILSFCGDTFIKKIYADVYINSLRMAMCKDYDLALDGLRGTLTALKAIPDQMAVGYLNQLVDVLRSYCILEDHQNQILEKMSNDKPIDSETILLFTQYLKIFRFLIGVHENGMTSNELKNLLRQSTKFLIFLYDGQQFFKGLAIDRLDEFKISSCELHLMALIVICRSCKCVGIDYSGVITSILANLIERETILTSNSAKFPNLLKSMKLANGYMSLYHESQFNQALNRMQYWLRKSEKEIEKGIKVSSEQSQCTTSLEVALILLGCQTKISNNLDIYWF